MKEYVKVITFLIVLMVSSCGSEQSDQVLEVNTEDSVSVNLEDTLEITQEDIAPPSVNEVLNDHNRVWQIDDYAEALLNEKIYNNPEEIDYTKLTGAGYYYEMLDIPNGFAKVTGAIEGWHEFVLFRMNNGNDLLGKMTVGCGPVCSYDYDFYEYSNGKIINDHPSIFPLKKMNIHKEVMHEKVLKKYKGMEYPEDAFLRYYFPQKGTDMKVDLVVGAEEVETPFMLLSWDGMKFKLKEKYTKVVELDL